MKKFSSVVLALALILQAAVIPVLADAAYVDYVPGEKPANMIMTSSWATGANGAVGWTGQNVPADLSAGATGWAAMMALNGEYTAPDRNWYARGVTLKGTDNARIAPESDTTYVFSAQVKTKTGSAAIGIANVRNYGTYSFQNEYPVEGYLVGTDWEIFNTTVTTASNAAESPLNRFCFGVITGAAVDVLVVGSDSLYMAKETAYDLTVSAGNATEIYAGEAIAFTASIVNQIGIKGKLDQNINWFVTDENRQTKIESGFSFTETDGQTTLNIASDVAPGNYVAIAENADNTEMRKGVVFTVLKPPILDYEPSGEQISGQPYNLLVSSDSSKEAFNVLDTLSLTAKVIDGEGNTEGLTQQFTWLALTEDRVDETDLITVTPSADTKTAQVTFDLSTPAGTYYVVAQSASDESAGMQRGYKIIIDDDGIKETIISDFENLPAEDIKGNLDTYAEIIHIEEGLLDITDKDELCMMIKENTFTAEDLADKVEALAYLSLLNSNPNNVDICDENNMLLNEEALTLDTIDSDNVTLYSLYKTLVDEEGREAILSDITEKGFKTTNEFLTAFKESVLLNALAYPNVNGTGYVEDVLTEENLDAVGANSGEYLTSDKKSKYNSAIAGEVLTIEELEEELAKTYTDKKSDNSSGGSSGYGGSYSGSTIKTDFSPQKTETSTEPEEKADTDDGFLDVQESHWGYPEIIFLKKLGVINGADNNCFYPDRSVTREEFLKMLCTAFDIEASDGVTGFADVDSSAWYSGYIAAAKEKGIVSGISETEFGIGKPITRQDMCVMLVRALGHEGEEYGVNSFADKDEISEYASSAVNYLSTLYIINGFEDNTFRPSDLCTRAQATKIISNTLHILDGIR